MNGSDWRKSVHVDAEVVTPLPVLHTSMRGKLKRIVP